MPIPISSKVEVAIPLSSKVEVAILISLGSEGGTPLNLHVLSDLPDDFSTV